MLNWGFLVCDTQNFIFLSVESHLPLLFAVPFVADFLYTKLLSANSLTVDRIPSGMAFM